MWHINGEVNTEGINEQLTEVKRSGFGGMSVLAVAQIGSTLTTGPASLNEEYFAYYSQFLETTAKLGMKAIFHDNINFPSAQARGGMRRTFPNHVQHRLDTHGTQIEGSQAWKGNYLNPEAVDKFFSLTYNETR
jgi:hypothetical protein